MARIQKGQKLTETQKQIRRLGRVRNELLEEIAYDRAHGRCGTESHAYTVAELNEVLRQIRELKSNE